MRKGHSLLNRIATKMRYIAGLVILTPNYGLIIVLQLISGTFNFAGLPMIIPILEFMNPSGASSQNIGVSGFMMNIFKYIGLELNFYTLLLMASILILSGQLLVIISSLIAVWAQNNLLKKYREQILNAYTRVDWLWLTNYHSGEIYHALIKEAELASVAHLNAQRVVIYTIQALAYLLLAIKLSLMGTLLAFALYGVLGLINLKNSRYVGQLNESYNTESVQLSKRITGLQQNKKFFKSSLLNNAFVNKIFTSVEKIVSIINKVNLRQQLQEGWTFTFTFLFLIMLVLFYKQLSINYFQLVLIVLVFNRLAPQFLNLSQAYLALNSNIPMHMSLKERLNDLKNNEESNGGQIFNGKDLIRFENVSFVYPKGNKAIENLNLTIQPNKSIAFVGGSGVGKSTILDLLLGLLKPSEGIIYYGDIPHFKLDLYSLRRKVAYVNQQPTLLDGTLKENLIIGNPQATEEMIREICKKVYIDHFIDQLPEGINTIIGENGIKLSGGQRQRVVLGRSLFMNPQILILDEATSELDMETEAMIQETINNLREELTIIIVAHRLSTVKLTDLIYVIEDGKISESGAYKELLDQKGRLFYLDSLQRVA